jgi:hypothetical protein
VPQAFVDSCRILFRTDSPYDHGVSVAFAASLDAAASLTAGLAFPVSASRVLGIRTLALLTRSRGARPCGEQGTSHLANVRLANIRQILDPARDRRAALGPNADAVRDVVRGLFAIEWRQVRITERNEQPVTNRL